MTDLEQLYSLVNTPIFIEGWLIKNKKTTLLTFTKTCLMNLEMGGGQQMSWYTHREETAFDRFQKMRKTMKL